jgi:hypothetical protein
LSVFKAQKNLREVNKVLEVETETATDSIIVNGQKTPLDIVFITSQDKRDRIQNELSGYSISTSPSLNKGKRPQTQDSKERIKDQFT